jgi:hypothetical protein
MRKNLKTPATWKEIELLCLKNANIKKPRPIISQGFALVFLPVGVIKKKYALIKRAYFSYN